MDHPRPGMRYVDAGDLDGSFTFDGVEVRSSADEKLGTVDGFIIDLNSGRPYYVVVDAGGWFTSKYFLLPIGHAGLDAANNRLIADISKDNVARYPGFNRDVFDKLSSADLNRLDREMASACCPDDAADDEAAFARRYDTWKHYQAVTWWDSTAYRPERVGNPEPRASVGSADSATFRRSAAATSARANDARREELITAKERMPGGRAQPGDVLGLETGGEQTHVGETSADENERRRDAGKAASNQRRD